MINSKFFYKFSFLLVVISSSFSLQIFSQNTEVLTISTYYPSPSGVYQSLRLFPSAQATQPICDNAHSESEGTLYFDNVQNQLQLCSTTAGTRSWGPLAGLWVLDGTNHIIYPNDLDLSVGIGTQTNRARLTIDNGANAGTSIHVRSSNAGFGSGIVFENYSTGANVGRTYSIYSNAGGWLVFGDETGAAVRMVISNAVYPSRLVTPAKGTISDADREQGEIWIE